MSESRLEGHADTFSIAQSLTDAEGLAALDIAEESAPLTVLSPSKPYNRVRVRPARASMKIGDRGLQLELSINFDVQLDTSDLDLATIEDYGLGRCDLLKGFLLNVDIESRTVLAYQPIC